MCRLWLAMLSSVGLMALPAAAAQADATWTGDGTTPEWSNATNWTGTPPASNTSARTLTFPTLGTCGTCYTSHNGLTAVSATGLVFSNTSGQYRLLGNSLRLGNGGISDTPGGGTSTTINAPLVLSSPQTWSVGSTSRYNLLTLLGGITGSSADALSMAFPKVRDADLFVDSDMEVGPVVVNGLGGFHIGGPTWAGSVNGTDGQPVTINGATLVANPSSTSGPLTLNRGTLLLGTNPQNNGTTTLHVSGGATLGSATTTETFINDNGSTPGTDFSQLGAGGNITVGGTLVVGQGPVNGSCVALNAGDVATLITTAGTLSGMYANAPQGQILTMTSSCQGTAPQVQIRYTSNSVMATVVGGTTTTTTPAAPTPTRAKKSSGRLLGPGARLTVIGRRIRVREKCLSSVVCRGRFSLTATVRAGQHKKLKAVGCASASFRIRANHSATIRTRLSTGCLRLLRAQRHHRLTVIYASQSQTRQVGQRKRITLVLK
ncbi:MAG TPA: hypothetical protein VG325_16050 [Solirubrobacteraceae bacterium]|jgi:hypothetical protein|nr:hypothetical protein [Solirubrobacteraceae bacterium]